MGAREESDRAHPRAGGHEDVRPHPLRSTPRSRRRVACARPAGKPRLPSRGAARGRPTAPSKRGVSPFCFCVFTIHHPFPSHFHIYWHKVARGFLVLFVLTLRCVLLVVFLCAFLCVVCLCPRFAVWGGLTKGWLLILFPTIDTFFNISISSDPNFCNDFLPHSLDLFNSHSSSFPFSSLLKLRLLALASIRVARTAIDPRRGPSSLVPEPSTLPRARACCTHGRSRACAEVAMRV